MLISETGNGQKAIKLIIKMTKFQELFKKKLTKKIKEGGKQMHSQNDAYLINW